MALIPTSTVFPSLATPTTNYSFSIKLTPRNYLLWKTQFTPFLNYHNLSGFINGTTPVPSMTILDPANSDNSISNPVYSTWFQRDQLVLS